MNSLYKSTNIHVIFIKMIIEQLVRKLVFHKKLNQLIFNTVFDHYSGDNLIKTQNSYSFLVKSPTVQNIALLVANFPDEQGFVQVQHINENISSNSINLKILLTFDSLLEEIDNFLNQQVLFFEIEPRLLDGFDCVDLNDTETDSNQKSSR